MIRVAVAGVGAIGSVVCRALIDGIDGFSLAAVSDLDPAEAAKRVNRPDFDLNFVPLEEIAAQAEWVIEALPAQAALPLARHALSLNKTMVAVSSSALLLHPEIAGLCKNGGRLLVPSGAIAGLDGVAALAETGIERLAIRTTKKPGAYAGAPYIEKNRIDLAAIGVATCIFSGHALEAAAAFPANVNVAATLTLASGLDPERVVVEAWADPGIANNIHEIEASNAQSRLSFKIENIPSPANPKSSALTALSVIALLRKQFSAFSVS